jgi:tetratricopeptide (TPR) repeat protein
MDIPEESMNAISAVIEWTQYTDALLADPDLEPSAERAGSADAKKKIEALEAAIASIVPLLPRAIEEVDGELVTLIPCRAAHLLADSAAVLSAAGEDLRAADWLAQAERMTTDDDHKVELAAAQKEPAVFTRMCLARWLLNAGRFADADREAKRVRRETKQAAFTERATKLLRGPRPIRGGAPSLVTVNGFGTGLYGSRDHDPEGSYIATRCVCLLFLPVFPLAAYRVKRVGATTIQYLAEERLSGLARALQALVGGAAIAGIAGFAALAYLDSAGHRASVALDEARAAEDAGESGRAMERYRLVVDEFSPRSEGVKTAVESIARLATKEIPTPCTIDAVEPARRGANAFVSLPSEARSGASAAGLVKRLDACAVEIGDADASQARGALRVLDLASDVAKGGADAAWVEARRADVRRAFAGRVTGSRPLLALGELAKLPDRASVAAAKEILLGFGDAPSLWIEAGPDITRWEAHAQAVNDGGGVREVKTRLAAARVAYGASEKLIAAGNEEALAKAAAEHPGDQELCAALASQRRAHGDSKGALELLTRLGPPGRLTASAQDLLANAHAEAGDLTKADEILSALVDERLPAFQDAQRAYRDAGDAAERRIDREMRADPTPRDLNDRLQGITDDGKVRAIVQAWMSERLAQDPALAAMRAEYLRCGQVVPASLSLGMIKLRRAADARGDDRKRLLAEAERAFLAIRSEAAGDPLFHLGLGQVYFRLGKPEEGEREFAGVIERGEPKLTLQVARTYRELGLLSRARQVARTVHETAAETEAKHSAADLLAHLATDLDEEEGWLQKADPSRPGVRNSLDRVKGERLLREGKSAEADQQFQKGVSYFDRDAKSNAVAANNAATETMRRYGATGDPAHLRAAVKYLDTSVKLEPDNSIVLSNLSSSLLHLAYVTVLSKWVDMRALILDPRSERSLLTSLLAGPAEAEVLEALRRDSSFQRSLDVSQKQQILAPQMYDAYQTHLMWYGWTTDTRALEDMKKRVDALPVVADANADFHAKWRSGEHDVAATRNARDLAAIARRRIDRTKSSSKPTQAVAWLALSEALQGLAYFERDPAMLDEMVEAARKALGLWPDGVSRRDLRAALFTAAFSRAVDASPALKRAWEKGRREHLAYVAAYLAAAGEDAAEVTGVLRKDPALVEAAALRPQSLTDRPTLIDFMIGRVAGNEELERAAAKVFDRKDVELMYTIDAKLDPSDENTVFFVKLLQTRGAAK